jgi:hypothetical protein
VSAHTISVVLVFRLNFETVLLAVLVTQICRRRPRPGDWCPRGSCRGFRPALRHVVGDLVHDPDVGAVEGHAPGKTPTGRCRGSPRWPGASSRCCCWRSRPRCWRRRRPGLGEVPTGKVPRLAPTLARSFVTLLLRAFVTQMLAPSKATSRRGRLREAAEVAPVAGPQPVTLSSSRFATQMLAPSKATPIGNRPRGSYLGLSRRWPAAS